MHITQKSKFNLQLDNKVKISCRVFLVQPEIPHQKYFPWIVRGRLAILVHFYFLCRYI